MTHFETLRQAKKSFKEKMGFDFGSRHSGITIFNRNKNRKKKLKRPFFVGTEFEWLNL